MNTLTHGYMAHAAFGYRYPSIRLPMVVSPSTGRVRITAATHNTIPRWADIETVPLTVRCALHDVWHACDTLAVQDVTLDALTAVYPIGLAAIAAAASSIETFAHRARSFATAWEARVSTLINRSTLDTPRALGLVLPDTIEPILGEPFRDSLDRLSAWRLPPDHDPIWTSALSPHPHDPDLPPDHHFIIREEGNHWHSAPTLPIIDLQTPARSICLAAHTVAKVMATRCAATCEEYAVRVRVSASPRRRRSTTRQPAKRALLILQQAARMIQAAIGDLGEITAAALADIPNRPHP